MNERIKELAEQAGFERIKHTNEDWVCFSEEIEAFAALVTAAARADEREACAKVCDELPAPDIYNNTDKSMWDVTCIDCATAIRARGTT
jgi:hypothetical protein